MNARVRTCAPAWLTVPAAVLAIGLAAPITGAAQGGFQESVRIDLPPSVTFYLTNLAVPTDAAQPTVIRFDRVLIRLGRALAISVRAEDRRFAAPFGPQIPIDSVSWRATNALNGRGFNGTLGRNWEEVFEGNPIPLLPGGVTLTWTMAPPPPGLAAGAHTVLIRWRLRVVNP